MYIFLFFLLNLLVKPIRKTQRNQKSLCEELGQFGLKVGPKKSKNEPLAQKLRKSQLFLWWLGRGHGYLPIPPKKGPPRVTNRGDQAIAKFK